MLREKWIIAVSMALGLAAAGIFYLYTSGTLSLNREGSETAKGKDVQMRTCVVAARDIEMRTLLTAEMLTKVEIPAGYAHPSAVASIAKCVGRITRDRLITGETVLAQNLREEDTPSELSFVLPEGMRAITLPVSVTSGVGNMVRPGDYVDVVVYLDENAAGKSVSFTLLRKMLVLATDNRIFGVEDAGGALDKVGGPAKDAKGYQSITLAANPAQCVKLNLAESTGRMRLTLHAPDEPAGRNGAGEVAALSDIAKEAGFTITGKAPAASGAQNPSPTAKTQMEKSDGPAEAYGAKALRVVHIMRGVEVQTVVARAERPGEQSAKRGEK